MKKVFLLSLLGLWFAGVAFGFDQEHKKWAHLLSASVSDQGESSQVNYDWLKAHPDELDSYLSDLQAVSLGRFQQWTQAEQLAFLINSYNAFTLQLVLTKYPEVDSIKDLGGFFSGPWKVEFFTLLGSIRDLSTLEHKWLRKKYQEPRVHFAIVCASVGCPALASKPYLATTLDVQLEKAKNRFLQDPLKNRYDAPHQTLYLSKIFDWFGDDFKACCGSVRNFVADGIAHNPEEAQAIRGPQVKIRFLDYDWSLNKLTRPGLLRHTSPVGQP